MGKSDFNQIIEENYCCVDKTLFIKEGSNSQTLWSPRLSRFFLEHLRTVINEKTGMRGARVEGRTPHSARHAIGRHIIEKTGNVAAVKRQLGHRNAA